MKTLMMSLMAAVFVMVAASFASADMKGANYHGLAAIDSAGLASVDIRHATAPVGFVKVYDKITLDSGNLWVVNDIYPATASFATVMDRGEMKKGSNLLCFDSISKFCARAY